MLKANSDKKTKEQQLYSVGELTEDFESYPKGSRIFFSMELDQLLIETSTEKDGIIYIELPVAYAETIPHRALHFRVSLK
jgi:hypothetical protein